MPSLRSFRFAATGILVLPLVGLVGCAGVTPTSDGGSSTLGGTVIDLTQAESDGLRAGVDAVTSLARATSTSQDGTRLEKEQAGQTIPEDVFFGTCPVVGLALVNGLTDFSVTVDFGAGCVPTGSSATCSGSAFGSVDRLNTTLTMAFNELSCGGTTLNGSMDTTFAVASAQRTLTGTWSLRRSTVDAADGTTGETSIFGEGAAVYDGDAQSVTVPDFTGTVTSDGATWNFSALDLAVSLVQNDSLIPSSGTISILNDDTRSIMIRFNENSPTTGAIDVSVNGSDFFSINLEDL